MSKTLPSLDLLRVFEACGRCLGFTAAGAELGMSQPAVSQQIQRLERALGTPLFVRVHRGIELTAAGVDLLAPVQEALALVQDGVARASAQRARQLIAVATDFAFAAFWLMPRLERFYRLHPHIDVTLVTGNRAWVSMPVDVDLAVVFGDGRVQRGESSLLLRERVFPVCSARLLAAHGGDAAVTLRMAPRLHLKPAPGQRWFDWQRAGHVWRPDAAAAPSPTPFDNYTQVISSALAGHGVAIGWQHLVDTLLAQGLLCRLGDDALESRLGYHLVVPQRKRQPAGSRCFAAWLQSEMRAPAEPTVDSPHA